MGSILQERVPQQYLERFSSREREWMRRKEASRSNNTPDGSSSKMGRRQSQKKTPQPQFLIPAPENRDEKTLQRRRNHKPNRPKLNAAPHSAQGPSESESAPLTPAEDRTAPKGQPSARIHSREKQPAGVRGRFFPSSRLTDSCPDLLDRRSPNKEAGPPGESDSDTDLSESERLPVPPSGRVPPQLELRPEVVEDEDGSSRRPKGRSDAGFHFPDFLPPPFNSWSLSQLAVFYNVEGRGAARTKARGPLGRYLERLLQLEWQQIKSCQEESGASAASDVTSTCRRSPASSSSRLSSPKCILQCQRAFPLTFLSSPESPSAMLSSCSCAPCQIRLSTFSNSYCRSARIHRRQCGPSPPPEGGGPTSLPKRSRSEGRVHFSDRISAAPAQRVGGPAGADSHLRRMQASGNIRSHVQGAGTEPPPAARDAGVGAARDRLPTCVDGRTGAFRRRGGSEQRGGRPERQDASEKRRSGSECRRGGAELKERGIKPDAVTAIPDSLPGPPNPPVNRGKREKQVEFVT